MNETEIWKLVPSTPGIEASSRGRINALDYLACDENGERYVNGGVCNQYDNGRGYLTVKIFYNGKWRTKSAHRLVCEAFIPNPNKLPEVNHKDNNPSNNMPSNLEWCSHQYNIEYREKYGTSSAEAVGQPLWVFDLRTGHKSYFNTQVEAEIKTGVANSNISSVLKGNLQQVGGYYFTRDDSEVIKERLQTIKDNMHHLNGVIAVNLKTQEVLRFKTRKEAAKSLGCDAGNIGGVIKGRLKQTHGYWFVHVDENTAEKTKTKFGNSIANKVAKLIECFCKE